MNGQKSRSTQGQKQFKKFENLYIVSHKCEMKIICRGPSFQTVSKGKTVEKGCIKAVIVGGGISGLLSAHVLAPYCASITIIDKDDLSKPPRISGGANIHVRLLNMSQGLVNCIEMLPMLSFARSPCSGGKVFLKYANLISLQLGEFKR